MRMPRFTIAQSMTFVLCFGLALAALRHADKFLAGLVYNLTVIVLSVALVCVLVGDRRTRARWAGFASFGWAYLILSKLPDSPHGLLDLGRIPQPTLLLDWGFACLQPYIKPLRPGMGWGGTAAVSFLLPYEQVSVSLGVLLFGLLGTIIGRLIAARNEQSNA